MPTADPSALADLVHRLVSSAWPTTEEERVDWFEANGLDPQGRWADLGDALTPGARSYMGEVPPDGIDRIGWRFFNDEFVGIFVFVGAGSRDEEIGELGAGIRAAFDSLWPGVPHHTSPGGDWSRWRIGPAMLQMYVRPTLTNARGQTAPGMVQLHVEHARRGMALEKQAKRSSM